MVFDRRFTAASTRYIGFGDSNEYRQRRALPVVPGLLCALDLVLLNGVRRRLVSCLPTSYGTVSGRSRSVCTTVPCGSLEPNTA